MRSTLAILVLSFPLLALADHDHDHQHDLGNIGKAPIATSCNEHAQALIDRGNALMHSFWYREAEIAFRQAAEADAECGMAWWGVAMSNLHPIWAPPTPAELKTGGEAAQKAASLGAKSDREKAYIAAINVFYANSEKLDHMTRMRAYESAMAELASKHPKEREAAIFHALALLGIADAKDKAYTKQKEAAAILNRVLPEAPEHPGVAHYLIHSFDYPDLAGLALPAARVYAKLAPGSPHALHMPSHIFTRLGLWDESIASNIASRDKAAAYVAKVMPGAAAFDELHAIDYLVYAYLQQGKVDDARKLVERVTSVTKIDNPDQFAAAYAISAAPARFAIERREWKEAAALAVPAVINWSKVPYAEANIHFARGIGGARSGNLDAARDALARLAKIRETLIEQKNGFWADHVEIQRLSVAAWIAHAEKNDEEALKQMRAAADLDASTEKHPVTPGAIVPARELLAELLLDLGRRDDAIAEAKRVLEIAPNRKNVRVILSEAKNLRP
jgi:tetratricopeptide (TPR) repeat protein